MSADGPQAAIGAVYVGGLHPPIEGMSLSLAGCMRRFKPHRSQWLLIREVWLDDVKRSLLNRLDPVRLFATEARMPHDASILSGGPHCCCVEDDELFRRCTHPLQHTQKVEVPAGIEAQVVHVTLPAEVRGDHYPPARWRT